MTHALVLRHTRRRIAIAVAAVFACASASAATITVTTGGDAGDASTCTLRQAIDSANADASDSTCVAGSGADAIEFDPALVGSVITLSAGQLSLESDITLTGSGQIIDAQNASRVMYAGPYQIAVSDLTLQHGNAGAGPGGGIYVVRSHLSLTNMTIANNAGHEGGGIQVHDSDISLAYSTISGNHAEAVQANDASNFGGGIVSLSNSSFTLDHVQITGNYASGGAGATAAAGIFEYGSSVAIRYSTISGNTASNQGRGLLIGGLYALHSSNLSITQSLIASNSATADNSTTG